jgi:ABC-type Mn2+/Zn2+ transport system permease subunit
MMALSVALCAASVVGGLLLSYQLAQIGVSAPPGPLVVLLAAVGYGLSFALRAAGRGRGVQLPKA